MPRISKRLLALTQEEREAELERRRQRKLAYDKARYPEIAEKKRAASAAWYAENTERGIAKSAARYAAKKDFILAQQAEKRRAAIEADPTYLEREAAQCRKQRAANPEKYRETDRRAYQRWKERNPGLLAEKMRKRYWKDPEKARARGVLYAQNRRARVLEAGGSFTAEDVRALFKKQKGKCLICLVPFGSRKPHVDHYVALARGGTNDPSNLRLLCRKCNMAKHAKDPIKFGLDNGLLCW